MAFLFAVSEGSLGIGLAAAIAAVTRFLRGRGGVGTKWIGSLDSATFTADLLRTLPLARP